MPLPLFFALGAAGTGALAAGAKAVGAARGAKELERGANRAMELQEDIYRQQQANYQQSRQDNMPWLQAGQTSLADLMRQMQAGSFNTAYQQFDPSQLANDPGFQFRLSEGQKALERSAAARGGLNSGGFMKGLSRYSQGVASDEFGNAWNRHQAEYATRQGENAGRFNRLSGLAGMGQNAAQYLGSLGQQNAGTMGNFANSMSGLHADRANARAVGASAGWNGVANGINSFNESLSRGMGMMGGMGGGGGGFGGMMGIGGGGGMAVPRQQYSMPAGDYGFNPNRGYG